MEKKEKMIDLVSIKTLENNIDEIKTLVDLAWPKKPPDLPVLEWLQYNMKLHLNERLDIARQVKAANKAMEEAKKKPSIKLE